MALSENSRKKNWVRVLPDVPSNLLLRPRESETTSPNQCTPPPVFPSTPSSIRRGDPPPVAPKPPSSNVCATSTAFPRSEWSTRFSDPTPVFPKQWSSKRGDPPPVAPKPAPSKRGDPPPVAPKPASSKRGDPPPVAPKPASSKRGDPPPVAPKPAPSKRGDPPPVAPKPASSKRGDPPPVAPKPASSKRGDPPPLFPESPSWNRGDPPPALPQSPSPQKEPHSPHTSRINEQYVDYQRSRWPSVGDGEITDVEPSQRASYSPGRFGSVADLRPLTGEHEKLFSGADKIHELSTSNFDEFIALKEKAFVMFYNPNSSASVEPAKEIAAAAERPHPANHAYASVNCHSSRELCFREDVTQLPMFKLYSNGFDSSTVRYVRDFTAYQIQMLVKMSPVLTRPRVDIVKCKTQP